MSALEMQCRDWNSVHLWHSYENESMSVTESCIEKESRSHMHAARGDDRGIVG